MNNKVGILDYPGGNTASIRNALLRVASNLKISLVQCENDLKKTDTLILPGQGQINACMHFLNHAQLIQPIRQYILNHQPVLAICVGLQLLLNYSEEDTQHQTMGLLTGFSKKIPNEFNKVPHMGWNEVTQTQKHAIWNKIPDRSHFYYAHSYHPSKTQDDQVLGCTTYTQKWSSVFAAYNLVACQFHPEKSHRVGLQFLYNFLTLST